MLAESVYGRIFFLTAQMQNNDLLSRVESLEKKTKLLLRDYNHVKEALAKSYEENQKLKELVQHQKQQLEDLTHKQQLKQIVATLENSQGSEELKLLIDQYLQKIDDCITLLSSQL